MLSIQVTIENQIAYLQLNRPEKLNSFNREMAFAMQTKLDEAAADPSIRCMVISGNGKAFCAGQDLEEVVDPEGPGMEKILQEHYNPIILRLRNIKKPIVAAVNGVAAGAGANIALACDIVICSENASFIQAFSKIGLIPDSGGTYHLPRLIGFQRASALMMLGDKIDAHQALAMGMVYAVYPPTDFEKLTKAMAEKLANMPTQALAYIKAALNQTYSNHLAEQLSLEDELQQKAANTHDFKEGVAAFLQKRNPHFTGN